MGLEGHSGMAVTLMYGDVEVNMGPSDVDPGKVRVTLFGPTENSLWSVITRLQRSYTNVEVTAPARGSGGTWGSVGRLWNA